MSQRDHESDLMTQALVKELDYSPLAIRVAGRYIHNLNIDYKQYIGELKMGQIAKLGQNIVSQAVEDNMRTTILPITLIFTIQKLKTQKESVRLLEVLQYCAYLSNENIPLRLLVQLCDRLVDENVELELKRVCLEIENYSLLTYDINTQNCFVHRTTQMVIRSLMSSEVDMIKKLVIKLEKILNVDKYDVYLANIGAYIIHTATLLKTYRNFR